MDAQSWPHDLALATYPDGGDPKERPLSLPLTGPEEPGSQVGRLRWGSRPAPTQFWREESHEAEEEGRTVCPRAWGEERSRGGQKPVERPRGPSCSLGPVLTSTDPAQARGRPGCCWVQATLPACRQKQPVVQSQEGLTFGDASLGGGRGPSSVCCVLRCVHDCARLVVIEPLFCWFFPACPPA